MIWTNTDYANVLLKAAMELQQHTGDEDLPSAIDTLEKARDAYGDKLHSLVHENMDYQDVLYMLREEHHEFDKAVDLLERKMRFLSVSGDRR